MSHAWNSWAAKHWGAACTQKKVAFYFYSAWDRVKQRRIKASKVYVAAGSKRAWKFLRREIKAAAPKYYAKMDDVVDDWGYNCRNIGNTNIKSQHAFALAVDLDAVKNAQGKRAIETPIWQFAQVAVLRWEKLGNEWGGRYSNPDAMHFAIKLTKDELKARLTRTGKVKEAYRKQVYG
jgi:hypothetical protein